MLAPRSRSTPAPSPRPRTFAANGAPVAWVAAAAVGLLLSGCTVIGDAQDADEGEVTSEDSGAGVQTRGEGCELAGRAQCMRALTCNLTFTDLELCTSGAVDACCADAGTCEQTTDDATAQRWLACTQALENQACEDVGTAPEVCQPLAVGF